MAKYEVTYDGTSLEFTGMNTGVHLSVEEYLLYLRERLNSTWLPGGKRLFIEDGYEFIQLEPKKEVPEALQREEEQ